MLLLLGLLVGGWSLRPQRRTRPDSTVCCSMVDEVFRVLFFFSSPLKKKKKLFFYIYCTFPLRLLVATSIFGVNEKKIGSIFYYWSTFCFYIAREKASSAGMNEPPRLLMMRFNFKSLFVQKKKKKREAKQHQTRKEWLLLERVEGGGRERRMLSRCSGIQP